MSRTRECSGIEVYYKAQQDVFDLQSRTLTGVLPHLGERGRNDEEHLRVFLRRILPHRFGIGTGFIVSADKHERISAQNDIIIADQFWNSPLFRELVAEVYPVETVYATIEVKGLLDKASKGKMPRKSDLDKALENIAAIRKLAKSKKYVRYVGRPKDPAKPDQLVAIPETFNMSLPPRGYIFGYAKRGWRTLGDFKKHLEDKLTEHQGAFLHGIVILEKNWFAFQEAYNDGVKVHVFDDNALLRFTNALFRGVQSMPMYVASIDDYHRTGLYKGVASGTPQGSGYIGPPEPLDKDYEPSENSFEKGEE
jgi:hypothetical protein